jgi:hypothetical protein
MVGKSRTGGQEYAIYHEFTNFNWLVNGNNGTTVMVTAGVWHQAVVTFDSAPA